MNWQGEQTYAHHLGLPDFDGVVPQAADDAGLVVLETVHTLAGLAPAVDPLEGVAPGPPVGLDSL